MPSPIIIGGPRLSDEIIGCIFDHIVPSAVLRNDVDKATLKTACLVSTQFAYYGRRGLYSDVFIRTKRQAAHFLKLCLRHADMPSHIKKLSITGRMVWNKEMAALKLASLLDILAEKGAVTAFRILFETPWDQWTSSLQASFINLLIDRPSDVLELWTICKCFPLQLLPIPWMCKRFCVNGFANGSSGSAEALSGHCSEIGVNGRVSSACLTAAHLEGRFRDPPLISAWIGADDIPIFSPYLITSGYTGLVEISLRSVSDGSLPSVVDFLSLSKKTLRSLAINTLLIFTSNSQNLSRFTKMDLPNLHTLTIFTFTEDLGGGYLMKSLGWLLLHLQKNRKLRPKQLNLVFVASFETHHPLTRLETIMQDVFVDYVFKTVEFFKFDSVIPSFLHPEGLVSLWLLFTQIPLVFQEIAVKRSIRKHFPKMNGAGMIKGYVAETIEMLQIADALSICPKETFISRYDATKHMNPSEEEVYTKFPMLRT